MYVCMYTYIHIVYRYIVSMSESVPGQVGVIMRICSGRCLCQRVAAKLHADACVGMSVRVYPVCTRVHVVICIYIYIYIYIYV